jgi:hypothetical protein
MARPNTQFPAQQSEANAASAAAIMKFRLMEPT